MAEAPEQFADVLRTLRTRARLTQQELADAAGLSLRTVSNLERGAAASPRKETTRLLGDALGLIGAERERFETAARGHSQPSMPPAAAALRSLPRDITGFTGRERELEQLTKAVLTAGGVVGIHAIGGMAGGRQDRVRGPCGLPAVRPVPGRADLPPAARAHAGAGAGRPGRCAGQPAARRRGSRGPDPAGARAAVGAVAGPGRGPAAAAGPRRRGRQ